MARPRFLDALASDRRVVLEPELRTLITGGATLAELVAWAARHKVQVSQATLANFKREVLGSASEDAVARVQREVAAPAAKAAPVGDRVQLPAAPPPPPPPPAAQGGAPSAAAAGEPLDHRAILLEQLERAQKTARTEENANARNAADKLLLDITERLRDLEREGEGAQRAQVVYFFPEVTRLEHLESDEP